MGTNFPTTLDTLTNPLSSDPTTAPGHASQHTNANDAIEALEAKVGIDSSAVSTSLDNKFATHLAAADPHTVYVQESLFDAKGDLVAASANDTPGKLTVGANDTILMADSAQALGLKWVASQTPSTQAFADGAAEGTADTYARGDHKHAMPTDPVTAHAAAGDPHPNYVAEATAGITGTFALAGDITPTPTGATNDWNPTNLSTSSVIMWNGASPMTLSGIQGGADGRILLLQNITSAQDITVLHDSTASTTPSNRFYLPGSASLTIGPRSGVMLCYDSTAFRWRVLGGTGTGGAAAAPTFASMFKFGI